MTQKFSSSIRLRNVFCPALFAAALLAPLPLKAATDVTLTRIGVDVMPDECENPYLDASRFMAFYDATIAHMAAKRGPRAKGIPELFAVSELRSELNALVPNPTESPLDRLVISQLCTFRKIFARENPPEAPGTPLVIQSSNPNLHDHLAKIAPKLYKDARAYVSDVLVAKAKQDRKNELLEKQWAEIRAARQLGRAKIRDMFE